MRTEYKQTAKYLTSAFQDLITLTNALQGKGKKECQQILRDMGVNENTQYIYKTLRAIHESKGQDSHKLENLLK